MEISSVLCSWVPKLNWLTATVGYGNSSELITWGGGGSVFRFTAPFPTNLFSARTAVNCLPPRPDIFITEILANLKWTAAICCVSSFSIELKGSVLRLLRCRIFSGSEIIFHFSNIISIVEDPRKTLSTKTNNKKSKRFWKATITLDCLNNPMKWARIRGVEASFALAQSFLGAHPS
jgi:hypothetical protein